MKKRGLIVALRGASILVRIKKRYWRLSCLCAMSLWLITFGFPGIVNGAEKTELAKQPIVFTTIFPRDMAYFSDLSAMYSEAFRQLGYGFRLISQPGERAMVDANQGIVDGEAARIMNIDRKKYANLIRVPHPIVTMKDGAYAIDDSIKIEGWQSLAGKPYKVGLLKGIKSIEKKLPLYVDQAHIVILNSVEQSIKMLKAKRIDLFIVGTQVENTAYMKSDLYKDVKCVGIVETKVLYPWLHKRHQHLVQPLADTLKAMQSEGVF